MLVSKQAPKEQLSVAVCTYVNFGTKHTVSRMFFQSWNDEEEVIQKWTNKI